MNKKDIFASLVVGELASWFLVFIIKNPDIPEFQQFAALNALAWFLPIILPIVFVAGMAVASKLGRIFSFFTQLAKFLATGILNTLMDWGIFGFLMTATGITSGLGIVSINTAAFLLATTNSYFWNKFWVFRKQGSVTGTEFFQFLVVSAIGLGINNGVVYLGTTFIQAPLDISPGAWALSMKAIATLGSLVWNFTGYKFIVFKFKAKQEAS
ncbi:MAG: GtrA family protein [Candidatus Wildermuthbacteria bacterium]|nr:GtrA family protein [Candidatus Wildermuthbacteria bacterium]